jgi:CBS domain-containing protein
MFDRRVSEVMSDKKLLLAAPGTPVRTACQLMARRRVGAVMVVEDEHLVGIFTERDATFRVLARGVDPEHTPLSEVMTVDPLTIEPHKQYGVALALMHKHGFRHVPVVVDGRPIGIVSARNALDPDMEDFIAEARRRERFSK